MLSCIVVTAHVFEHILFINMNDMYMVNWCTRETMFLKGRSHIDQMIGAFGPD